MSTPTLHYIYDPLCGWCYGAAPLVRVARGAVRALAHAGGMMAGTARRAVTPELRQFVMTHDRRIAQASGQPFGQGYSEGLLLARIGGQGFPTFALERDGRFMIVDIGPTLASRIPGAPG